MIPSKRMPSHPGKVLKFEYLDPLDLTASALATHLGVAEESVARLLSEEAPVTPELAWLLGMSTGTGPELWMDLQSTYDLALHRPSRTLPRLVG